MCAVYFGLNFCSLKAGKGENGRDERHTEFLSAYMCLCVHRKYLLQQLMWKRVISCYLQASMFRKGRMQKEISHSFTFQNTVFQARQNNL